MFHSRSQLEENRTTPQVEKGRLGTTDFLQILERKCETLYDLLESLALDRTPIGTALQGRRILKLLVTQNQG